MDTTAFVRSVIAGQIRHVLTLAAGSLVTLGLLDTGQTENFVVIGTGIVVGLVGVGWSYVQKRLTQKQIAAS